MPSTITPLVFSEPSGRPNSLVQFGGALVFLGIYASPAGNGAAASSGWLLLLAAGAALSGIAESLPTDRRRAAGVLRLAAILLLTGLLGATVFAPETVVG